MKGHLRLLSLMGLTAILCAFATIKSNAQAGKDGTRTITTTGNILNRYTTLTATAAAGSTSLTVANLADLSASAISSQAVYTSNAIGYGDLVMIIKMQGASINTVNSTGYGAVTAMNGVGTYELKEVDAASGNTIFFCGGLVNNYTVSSTERVQVIRIPRLSGLTVNAGASIVPLVWSGAYVGGVVALEVNGNAVVNGSISANGSGFRAGAIENLTNYNITGYVSALATDGAEKGESIAGYQADYDALGGRYGRGAAANGGGGGNAHNSAGGGGANAANGRTWTGQGVMSGMVAGAAAWQLDPGYIANGNVRTNSSGGGRGGYSYSNNDADALTAGPSNAGWGGDNRREIGGLGGRGLTYTSTTLFMGGGGGAGDANNSATQPGGNGGGIVYLLATGTLSGSGSITADGGNALPTTNGHNDGASGGGGGGAIRLNVAGSISLTTVSAIGGKGGSQLITTNEAEGPGGGGGGGFISSTGAGIGPAAVAGGASGTTTSPSLTEFPVNGSTAGAAGSVQINQAFSATPTAACSSLLPTQIVFEAQANAQHQVVTTWVSENETQGSEYVVEKSDNGRQWRTIATVAAYGKTGKQYYTAPAGLLTGDSYYRLKLVAATGSATYSNIKFLITSAKVNVQYQGGNLLVNVITAGATSLQIFNANGSLVYKKQLTGENNVQISSSLLTTGMYYIKLYSRSSAEETIRFLKA